MVKNVNILEKKIITIFFSNYQSWNILFKLYKIKNDNYFCIDNDI